MAFCSALLNFVCVCAAFFLLGALILVTLYAGVHDSVVLGFMDKRVAAVTLDEGVLF